MLYLKNYHMGASHILVVPFMFSVIIPLIITDIWMEAYHRVCFWLCGMPYVKRSNYIKIDRHKLKYLTWYDKFNCAYCGYSNGVLAYWAKIASETERYWCGIKHKENPGFIEPAHHDNFTEYGDEMGFNTKYKSK